MIFFEVIFLRRLVQYDLKHKKNRTLIKKHGIIYRYLLVI